MGEAAGCREGRRFVTDSTVSYEPFDVAIVENKLPSHFEAWDGMDNQKRANAALIGLAAYAASSGLLDEIKTDPSTILSDFLADLRHWVDENNVDWMAALSSSQIHYVAEATGQEP